MGIKTIMEKYVLNLTTNRIIELKKKNYNKKNEKEINDLLVFNAWVRKLKKGY